MKEEKTAEEKESLLKAYCLLNKAYLALDGNDAIVNLIAKRIDSTQDAIRTVLKERYGVTGKELDAGVSAHGC